MRTDQTDVAIVGGGVSGLYTAWRLSNGAGAPQVKVFEASQRLGGRIDSVKINAGGDTSSVELGAMRFTQSMALVRSLLGLFQIPTEPFPGSTTNQLFLRNVDIPLGNPLDATAYPFHFGPGECPTPTDPEKLLFGLLMSVLNQAVPNAVNITPDQWREIMTKAMFRGRPLYKWGMWNVASELISNEAYEFVSAAFGVNSAFQNHNAAMAVRMMVLPVADLLAGKVFRPTPGWGSLLEKFEADLETRPTCSVQTAYRLTCVHWVSGSDAHFELLFADPHGDPYLLSAKRAVMAMPRRALELVDFSSLFDIPGPQLFTESDWNRKLDCAVGIPAFKLGMLYDSAWWQNLRGWNNGVSVTDLPIRQLFYGMGQGPDADANQRVLIASYADTLSARFWAGLAQVSPADLNVGVNDQFEETDRGSLLSAVQRQQQLLFGYTGPLPPPKWVGYMDWSIDPYGGAWHEWRPGVDVISAIAEMRQPFEAVPLYVCGEAYSWMQAWIEGALISAERVLQERFDLPRPEWLPADYDLGP